ncbi:hypothetical protein TREES_T100001638 [Tupaia chinensis]|uniref:Uncharacterized protein n=1 Tax=Tupaia chinensis TaxID=246437 RepID=L9KP43_TUPCH|nr:hypothetical protein TREES_T100001638 [Tupaia chinensis]
MAEGPFSKFLQKLAFWDAGPQYQALERGEVDDLVDSIPPKLSRRALEGPAGDLVLTGPPAWGQDLGSRPPTVPSHATSHK